MNGAETRRAAPPRSGPAPTTPPNPPTVAPAMLFTAFEPSGDNHAAPIIRELLRQQPDLRIYAWGGPRMAEAGATVVEQTCDQAAMGLSAIGAAGRVRKHIAQIRRWSKQYKVLAHVPVDSPAANFPVCGFMKKTGARVIHLVAPQLWAWGSWRIGKLRRLTDAVLCILPFEEEWFTKRKVPAKFIGHPAINRPLDEASIRERASSLPAGSPRVAMFPGSRAHEVAGNIRLMMDTFVELQGRHQGMAGLIVAASQDLAKLVRRKIKVFPTGLHMTVGGVDAAVAWCDLALAVSGTITMDIALQRKPMVGMYKSDMISWLGAKLLIRTPFKLLPNIVAGREIVPEFVPHVGGSGPIIDAATTVLKDSKRAAMQAEELNRMVLRFRGHDSAREGAEAILKVMRTGVLA
jgi:lipid-A-disaccharide synthase